MWKVYLKNFWKQDINLKFASSISKAYIFDNETKIWIHKGNLNDTSNFY